MGIRETHEAIEAVNLVPSSSLGRKLLCRCSLWEIIRLAITVQSSHWATTCGCCEEGLQLRRRCLCQLCLLARHLMRRPSGQAMRLAAPAPCCQRGEQRIRGQVCGALGCCNARLPMLFPTRRNAMTSLGGRSGKLSKAFSFLSQYRSNQGEMQILLLRNFHRSQSPPVPLVVRLQLADRVSPLVSCSVNESGKGQHPSTAS